MADDLSFKAVCGLLRQHEPHLLDAVDTILGPAILLSGLAGAALGSPAALAAAGGLLGPKNALTAAGRSLLQRLAAKRYGGSLDRFQRMQAAYCLLSFTAFFDAIDGFLPALRKAFGLRPNEKIALAATASMTGEAASPKILPAGLTDAISGRPEDAKLQWVEAEGILDQEIPLPHPAEGSEVSEEALKHMYHDLAVGYERLVHTFPAWEKADEKTRKALDEQIATLPARALVNRRAQYVDLARQFPEFFVWASLHEQAKHRASLQKLSTYWELLVALSNTKSKQIDLGFAALGRAIQALPSAVVASKHTTVIAELLRRYAAYIEQPVVEEEFPTPASAAPLRFPKRSEAFVPQAFRVLRATGRERLEDESTWSGVRVRQDLGTFVLSYFSSPYSFRYPLLILGDPGSGKSLLTHMLAARLICPQFTPIRVELRALESDEIAQQIEEQISRDTNGQRVSWPMLNTQLLDAPALVLLDGYDELLQASGKVYAGYLQSVRQFQDTERTLLRPPVRAVVTSRITLIDKTRIPAGTTVIRLEPFDKSRQDSWVGIWNRTNAEYFKRSSSAVLPFELPTNDRQIAELAEQPLLLLMLAIYDSYANDLRKTQGLDRTRLYENLLRRFIERELSKHTSFSALREEEQGKLVSAELERLGVVAISMFNRRSLLIKSDELELDLRFFECERNREVLEGRALRQSDLLLGSFFFVHESRSAKKARSGDEAEIESAFQFLHNTFGEFLAARFLVEHVLEQANKVHHLRQSPVLAVELEKKLVDPSGLDRGWIASLIYTPLFSRPVVVEMVREWLPHRLGRIMDLESFRSALDTIVNAELRRFLERGSLPSLMSNSASASFRSLPLLGHLAIYTCNLIVLRTTIPDGEFVFRDSAYTTHEDGTKPWDRLTHTWKSWFALDSLHGLTAILATQRSEDDVRLTVRERFSTPSPRGRLEALRDVGRVLGDGALAGLAALESWDPLRGEIGELEEIRLELERERLDLRLEVMTRYLQSRMRPFSNGDEERLLTECILLVDRFARERPGKTVEMVRAIWARPRFWGYHFSRRVLHHLLRSTLDDSSAEDPMLMVDLLADIGDRYLDPEVLDEFFERSRRVIHSLGTVSLLPVAVRIGHWPLATHLAESVIEAMSEGMPLERLTGRTGRVGRISVSPEIVIALFRVAEAVPDKRWPAKALEELWVTHVTPSVVAGLPAPLAREALRLVPRAMDTLRAREWLERFVSPESIGDSSFRAVILMAADVARELLHPIATPLANDMVRIRPREIFASWSHRERWRRETWQAGPASWEVPNLGRILRVVRLATDKKQAGIWLRDFVLNVLLPELGGLKELPAEAVVELLGAFKDFRVDPEEMGLSLELLAHKRHEVAEWLQLFSKHLEPDGGSFRAIRKDRRQRVQDMKG
jgi:hypothetical protein